MDANNFVTWLHGFVEACGDTLTREQCDTLRGQLNKFEENKRDHEKQVVLLQRQAFLARQEAKLKAVEAELEQAERKREPATGKSFEEITKQIEEDAKKQRGILFPDKPYHLATVAWGEPVVPTWGTAGVHKVEYVYAGGQQWWIVDGDAQGGEERP